MTTMYYAARAEHARPADAGHAIRTGARTIFEAPALFVKRRFVAARTRTELSQLSDAQLADIGVIRGDIHSISTEMAARVIL